MIGTGAVGRGGGINTWEVQRGDLVTHAQELRSGPGVLASEYKGPETQAVASIHSLKCLQGNLAALKICVNIRT